MDHITTLYLVRHGETDYNRRRIVQGRGIDASLNPTGRSQAHALARRFANVSFDAVYTSSMRRAIETASFVLEDRPKIPLRSLDDLDEMAWGVYEGQPATPDVQQVFEEYRMAWANGCFDQCVEGGESIYDVQRRGLRAFKTIMDQHAGDTVFIVSHGRFLRVLLSSVLDGYSLEHMQQFGHTNTGVNRITCRDGVFTADLLNCIIHLEAIEQST